MRIFGPISILILCAISVAPQATYEPTWDSLDSRPLPSWYDKAKIGIFIHWGVYSVPSFGSEWFWWHWKGENSSKLIEFMSKNYPPDFTYQDFAPSFRAEFFEPKQWASLFKQSGAKYVVLTSKHHEGFALWPSKYSYSWNAVDMGPNRDLLGELAVAVRNENLTFGVYHSLYEWFHPLYRQDHANNGSTRDFVDSKIIPEMKELIEIYKPDILWSDGDWDDSEEYWQSKEFLAWLYNESPIKNTVVTNDRWGKGVMCYHGGFLTCADRYNPGVLLPRKWENAMTLDSTSWGYRRNANLSEILTINELLSTIVGSVSCGGNVLINVGPTKEGTIVPIFQERLIQLGAWLSINGEAIYETIPWIAQNDTLTPDVWYTSSSTGENVYITTLNWPEGNILRLAAAPWDDQIANIVLLGNEDLVLKWSYNDTELSIQFPDKAGVASKWAWALKLTLKIPII